MTETHAPGVDPAGWRPIETADRYADRLFLGVVRGGRLDEVHIGFFSFAYNEDEVDCWWSAQSDDEISPQVWMPFVDIPLRPSPPPEAPMAGETLPARQDMDRALVAEIAMDIGKEAVSHLRVQYPEAFKALGNSGALSLRNCVRNQIMAALETTDADEIADRLKQRRAFRRKMHTAWDRIRDIQTQEDPTDEH